MTIQHNDGPSDDQRPQKVKKTNVATPGEKKASKESARRADWDAKIAKEREDRKVASARVQTSSLLNPLGEDRLAQGNSKSAPVRERVKNALATHRLRAVYQGLLPPDEKAPLVCAVALLAPLDPATSKKASENSTPTISQFKSLLADIRRDYAAEGSNLCAIEAKLWGVPRASPQQIQAYVQEVARISGGVFGDVRQDSELAAIKVNGAIALSGYIFRVLEKLHSWSPQGAWEKSKTPDQTSCKQVGEQYLREVGHLVPQSRHRLLDQLSQIVWNEQHFSTNQGIVHGTGIRGLQLAGIVLRAAILNGFSSTPQLQPTSKDVLEVINPSNAKFKLAESKILDTLRSPPDSSSAIFPNEHKIFLREIIRGSRQGQSLESVVEQGLSSLRKHYSLKDVALLLQLERSIPTPSKPLPFAVPEHVEYNLEDFLISTLAKYVDASQRCLLWRVATTDTGYQSPSGVTYSEVDISRLAELSVILAGIPRPILERCVESEQASA